MHISVGFQSEYKSLKTWHGTHSYIGCLKLHIILHSIWVAKSSESSYGLSNLHKCRSPQLLLLLLASWWYKRWILAFSIGLIMDLHKRFLNVRLILTCMKFNDSVAGVCVGILYVWQLWVLVDSVVYLGGSLQWTTMRWKDNLMSDAHARASLRFITWSK